MVRALLGILLPVALGLPFTLWLRSWLVRVAMAFLVGAVVITAGLTVVGAAGLRFSPLSLAPAAVLWLLAAALAVRRSKALIGAWPSWPSGWGWPAWALLALAGLNVATAAAYAVRVPISDTDVVVIWLPKAQLIATGGFKALAQSVYPDYPPLWPLHIYLANGGGAWLKLLPSAYLIATLLIVFDFVRSRVGTVMAAACALAISGVPYIWLPYGVNDLMSEIPTMAFVTASTIMLAGYVDQPSAARAAVTSLAAIGTVWARPEGFLHAFLIGTILVIAGFRLHRSRQALLPAGAIVIAYLGWRFVVRFVFHYTGGLQANPAALTPSVVLSSLTEIVRYAAANVGNPYLFGPALIAVACVALGLTRWRLFGIVGFVLAVDVGIGIATYTALPSTDVGEPLIWWLTTGFKRMLMHLTPLLYITAALAIGSLLQRSATSNRSDSQRWRLPDWGRGGVLSVAVIVLTSITIVIAAYSAYRVGGPKSYDLSVMFPAHVSGSELDLSVPGAVSVTTASGTDQKLLFYLQNTGRRVPPLDNITGVFWRFSSLVAVQSGSGPAQFTASVDGRMIGEVTANPEAAPVALSGQIPIGGRFLELSVRQLGPGPGVASWAQPTVYRASEWWLVEAFLLLGVVAVVASGLAASGVLQLHPLLNPGLAASALLAAAAVQQAEAMLEEAMPIWSGAVELVMHHL